MQVELSDDGQEALRKQMTRDGFASSSEAIENAIRFYEAHRPSMDLLNSKLRDAHRSAEAGDLAPLEVEEIKCRGRERIHNSGA